MAPAPRTIIEDEEEFLNDVAEFHKRRGTTFDREGKVSGRPISLHKLYKLVMERGGYDPLSAERMAWRTIVREFGFGKTHEAVMTFQLKTVYYKNLAAYEIATYWGEEPPPKEILEDLSAKGGNLRTRTLENYPVPSSQAAEAAMADGGETADEEHATPKRQKTEVEEPESASRNAARQLRQDPKRTQIFQPDIQPQRSRSVRATDSPAAQSAPPPTYSNNSNDPHNPAFDWFDKYEPRPGVALTLRQARTPANDPLYYAQKAQAQAAVKNRASVDLQKYFRSLLPTAMAGPDIYMRCLNGLRSGIPEQQQFALHHMVKMSFERGDKYKCETFPGLAEGLIEKALEITVLAFGVDWQITYDEDKEDSPMNVLNGAFGTSDLLRRIETLMPKVDSTEVMDKESAEKLERLNEAVWVLRNLAMLDDNAIFLSKLPLLKDFLVVALSIPDQPQFSEFRRTTLEISEQVTRYWPLRPGDPLYLTLLQHLNSFDRAVLLSAIRSINRFGIATAEPQELTQVPMAVFERILSIIFGGGDDELLENAMTFIYAYTALPENNRQLLSSDIHYFSRLIPHLVELVTHAAESMVLTYPAPAEARKDAKRVVEVIPIPVIPPELHAHLLQFIEPERSSRWLRCCFEESPGDDVTQIAIWQAYSSRFHQNNPVQAAEFIKNVSSTFSSAQAQVINGPTPRFIIRGIKPRRVLLDLHGRPMFQCLWQVQHTDPKSGAATQQLCSSWHSTRDRLWTHIVADHLRLPKDPKGGFIHSSTGASSSSNFMCRWAKCSRRSPMKDSLEFSSHIRTHIPDTPEEMAKLINAHDDDANPPENPSPIEHQMVKTTLDETGRPAGVPMLSVFIMRNLARFANRHGEAFEKDGVRLNRILFGSQRYALFSLISKHRTLRDYLADLVHMIDHADQQEEQHGADGGHEDEDVIAKSG
ncbi:hypothetical protein ABEF91_008800 [Exophiala dermatitidis]